MYRIYFESNEGARFEILRGSHVTLKKAKGSWFYWEWDEIPTIQGELDQILVQGEEMFERVSDLIESHPGLTVSY